MDQSAEDEFAGDPVGLGWERDHVWVVVDDAQARSVDLVAAAGVVVRDVLVQDDAKVAFAESPAC